jgi:type VI protein secretion system component Hcp
MKSIYVFFALLLCLLTTTAFSQQAIYMKADGIDGPVTATGYANSFELTSVQFGESFPEGGTSGGGTTPKPSFTTLTITKLVDAVSSAELVQNLVTGKHMATAQIDYVSLSDAGARTTYKVELKNVLMVKHSISVVPNCPNGCVGLTESFQLDYTSIRVTTYKQLPSGSVVAGGIYSYNKVSNSPTF